MKRVIALLTAMLLVVAASASMAEELSALTDEELTALHRDALAEMEKRGIEQEEESKESRRLLDNMMMFFSYWSVNDLGGMLEYCTSDWKAAYQDPRTGLFVILANRTPKSVEIEDLYGDPEKDGVCMVTVICRAERNNGMGPADYYFQVLMKKEEDGNWYLDPRCLRDFLEAEIQPEPTPEPEE